MKHKVITFKQDDSPIMQNSIPEKMLVACFFSCIIGVVLMAIISRYLLMAVFLCVLLCISITTPLCRAGKISVEAACLAPMLILCFVYTPISWFTFNGPLGCTPYLSILFITVITLTYYSRIQVYLLSLYVVMMIGLTIYWIAGLPEERDMHQIINILTAYVLTTTLIVFIVEGVKRKNHEINKRIADLSVRDDLTGLLNRRAIVQVFGRIENVFVNEKAEYAIVMLDIDRFKSINDLYGHHCGDSVLRCVAACIQKSIRQDDDAFRFGGDEFLLVLPKVDLMTATHICARIEAALSEVHDYEFPITISVGCALRSESSNTTAALELADQRMYDAKRSQNREEKAAEAD